MQMVQPLSSFVLVILQLVLSSQKVMNSLAGFEKQNALFLFPLAQYRLSNY